MRLLLIGVIILSASCTTPKSQPIDGVRSAPESRPEELSGKQDEQLSSRELRIARARAAFPEAKRRFLAGLPAGYKLVVLFDDLLVTVDKIEGGQIEGHWPLPTPQFIPPGGSPSHDTGTFSETDLIDWRISGSDKVIDGDFSGQLGPLMWGDISGSGGTCSQAEVAFELAARSKAVSHCGVFGYSASEDPVLRRADSCKWNETAQVYQIIEMVVIGCCRGEECTGRPR